MSIIMSLLQLSHSKLCNGAFTRCHSPSFTPTVKQRKFDGFSCFWGERIALVKGVSSKWGLGFRERKSHAICKAERSKRGLNGVMNLSEYMVTLEKPLGIMFAQSVDGRIFVHALKKGGNAEKSRMIMVGDTLKKANTLSGDRIILVEDVGDALKLLKDREGTVSLILERPFPPFPINQYPLMGDPELLFNRGRVPIVTWNRNLLTSNLQPSSKENGNVGFVCYSPKFLKPLGWKLLSSLETESLDTQGGNGNVNSKIHLKTPKQIIRILSEVESGEVEWSYGNFPVDEYIKALDRSEGELYYNHFLGMQYSKITDNIYVGSCIQTESDVQTLSNVVGISAVLNFQSESERANWGIQSEAISDACHKCNILMVNCPIRDADSMDLRKKLPFCVGLLYRLLRKNLRVYVTCTTGLDRSPACVIAYFHWIQDAALHEAYNFVTRSHSCRPDRPAIVWATWDLIAMVEKGTHNGPPTHAVKFVWNGGSREGEEVFLIGDFTGNWKESIKADHRGGSKYEVELRLPQGKYSYKFIVGGQWRHSTSLPTETDQTGNVNNVIRVGEVASVRPASPNQQHAKDPMIVKVIERPLTEEERFMLACAARLIAFSICPIRLVPK
ncbi:phosphoglucan phosphatase LSF1, chloroplastic isoform X1 [Amborella trichopoda]|nr:phosphoglucan phosphatase LSF1, chloroplastic isoform X1 [Amborella trichopoda]|eukprot:XP_006844991.2 phosphoglucan phosphatase LSF1, chloroplastic isoform X1 [Amborella trichopoda]